MKHSFVVVGFPKCATTTLDRIFRQHPQIALPGQKEAYFFEVPSLYEQGIEWYESRYFGNDRKKYDDKIAGLINPRCIFKSPEVNMEVVRKGKVVGMAHIPAVTPGLVLERILTTFGKDVKLIYIVRNPISATASMFKHFTQMGALYRDLEKNLIEEDSFDKYVKEVLIDKNMGLFRASILDQYYYGKIINEAYSMTKPENIMVLTFDDLKKDLKNEVKKVLQFIGADPDVELDYNVTVNIGDYRAKDLKELEKIRKLTAWYITDYIPTAGFQGEEQEREIDEWFWNIKTETAETIPLNLTISDKTKELLREYYHEDVKLLSRLIGKDMGNMWGI